MEIDPERQAAREAMREKLRVVEAAGPPTSLYTECLRYAESTEDGVQLLMYATLFSEPWSRPPTEEIVAHDAAQAYDHGMHLKTQGEYAIAHAYKVMGDAGRHAFHVRKAEIGYPRLYWPSDAFLEHSATEMQRAKKHRTI